MTRRLVAIAVALGFLGFGIPVAQSTFLESGGSSVLLANGKAKPKPKPKKAKKIKKVKKVKQKKVKKVKKVKSPKK